MNADQRFNFPSLPYDHIAPALIKDIVPALADVIHETAVELAAQECSEAATIFDVERIAGDLLYALADLLTLSPVPLRGVRDLLRFHQLDPVNAAAFFDVDVALPLFVTRDSDDASGATREIPLENPQPPSSRAVVFADAASAAAVLNLSPAVIEQIGGTVTCANKGCKNAPRACSPYCSDRCYNNAYQREKRAQARKS